MSARLSKDLKLEIVRRIQSGESITSLSQEQGISRTILYKWLRKYQSAAPSAKNKVLIDQVASGKQHWKSPPQQVERDVIKLSLENPQLSPQKIATKIGNISGHGVWNILKRRNLNTLKTRTAHIYRNGTSLIKAVSHEDKITIIRRFEAGEPIAKICQDYNISRTIFYRWLKRYQSSSEQSKTDSLINLRPKGPNHWKFIQGEYEEAVLDAVRKYPELSSQRLIWTLPQVGGTPIVSPHGVHNVLTRHNLSTYQQRLAYAESLNKPTPASRFFGVFQSALTYLGNQEDSSRQRIVKATFGISFGLFAGIVLVGSFTLLRMLISAPSLAFSIGMIFSLIALTFGMFFFAYSMKYYLTIALVLSFSRQLAERGSALGSKASFVSKLHNFISSRKDPNSTYQPGQGLFPDLSKVSLDRSPFVSIQIATYNEKRVLDRLLIAATSMDYENYEVVLADDSNDETLDILRKWQDHPRVKIIHRDNRQGFKGGALGFALQHQNPQTEFIIVFDADFIPYPDTITQFLKYFKLTNGSLDQKVINKSNIAAVQGYQWHVLNKSENWITRGVRSEYSGSYVIERSGEEIYAGLKQISGSVYMIRAEVLQQIGWGTSLTEDFELTLKLYEQGYKVVFTPYIQAPSECASTIKRLIRQRMRWAEGHSFNVKKMFKRLLFSKNLTKAEKLEFLYLAPYYLQAAFFIVGTLSWFIAEIIFQARLPFWSATWGWSLVFTNLFALPLMNLVGLFLEESDNKDYLGLGSFVILSYILAPFQAYAAIKGLIEKEEGPWFRTPKTGKITDVFTPNRFYKLIFGVFGKRSHSTATVYSPINQFSFNQYLSLATANNQFDDFQIPNSQHKRRWLSKSIVAGLLLVVMGLGYFSNFIVPTSNAQGASFASETSLGYEMQDIDPKLMDIPSDYQQVSSIDLDSPNVGQLSKTQIASQTTKTSFQVKDQKGDEVGLSFELDKAGAGEISKNGNKLTRKGIYSGIDLQQEIYDGYLNQIMTLTKDTVNKEFSLSIAKNDNLILKDYSGHITVKDKNTNEELILFRFPQGIDAKNHRIDYKYEIQGDRVKLYPNRSWQYEKASYPIKIFLPVNVIAWNEGTIQVGENCPNPGCAKDGDASNFRPAGWWWGTEEKRLHTQIKVPKMTEEEREEFNSKTITLEEEDVPNQKEKERAFSHAGLARYTIDYTQLATDQVLAVIRNKNKKNFSPILDAKKDKAIIKKKTDLLASSIPGNRRMDYAMTKTAYSNKGFFATLLEKIIKPVFADGVTVKTIGSASRNFSCIQGAGCWEDSQNGDLVSAGALHGIQEGDLYKDSTFSIDGEIIDGSTTNSTHYMYLTAPASERHNGTATTGVVLQGPGNAGTKCVSARDNFTRLEWFEVTTCKGGSTARSIEISNATSVLIQYLIIHNFDDANTSNGIGTSTTTGTTDDFIARNSIIYDGGDIGIRGGGSTTVDTGLIENVTIYNVQDAGADGIEDNGASFTVKNTISMRDAGGTGSDLKLTAAGSSQDYNLCTDNAADCAANDASATCTNCVINKAATNQFVSITGGSEDLHLKTGADAIDAGTTLTDSTDIDLNTRPNGSAWDIGADEIPENLYGLLLLAPFGARLLKKFKRKKK